MTLQIGVGPCGEFLSCSFIAGTVSCPISPGICRLGLDATHDHGNSFDSLDSGRLQRKFGTSASAGCSDFNCLLRCQRSTGAARRVCSTSFIRSESETGCSRHHRHRALSGTLTIGTRGIARSIRMTNHCPVESGARALIQKPLIVLMARRDRAPRKCSRHSACIGETISILMGRETPVVVRDSSLLLRAFPELVIANGLRTAVLWSGRRGPIYSSESKQCERPTLWIGRPHLLSF